MDSREPNHTGGPEADGAIHDGSRRAGAYGFSRREIAALLAVAVVAGGFGLLRWWQRATAPEAPPWVVESIIIDPEQAANTPPTRPGRGGRSGEPPPPLGGPIDVNTASRKELARLPGIGSVIAARIIASREKDGWFHDRRDLQRVNGIGSQKVAALGGWVVFSDSAVGDSGRAP
jgi:competence ComEA-like helix-hairpin-helix protein